MKIGDVVKIIGNNAHSNHKIGDVGIIMAMKEQGLTHAHCLISVNGQYRENGSWSYNYDLRRITKLNNIKTL